MKILIYCMCQIKVNYNIKQSRLGMNYLLGSKIKIHDANLQK